ncbi:hypothetical protein EON67_12175 [archaeon]|nr:MAG: hypothetical protein EON67_12175 [archaeon]
MSSPRVRFGSVFGGMLTACPGAIAAYGSCVSAATVSDAASDVRRGGCETQFQALKACFVSQRKALTSAARR